MVSDIGEIYPFVHIISGSSTVGCLILVSNLLYRQLYSYIVLWSTWHGSNFVGKKLLM